MTIEGHRTLTLAGADDEARQTKEALDARVDGAEEAGAGQRTGECGERVDLAFADVDEDRTRAHPRHRPADAEQQASNDIAAMARFQFDRNRPSERGAAVAFDQPDARRGDRDRGPDDSVELEVREQEHRLDVVVVRCAAAAQDESEDRAEHDVEQRHHEPV